MGYCPQMNTMINSLNAYEHLRLFARIRGISKEFVESEVEKWIKKLGNYFSDYTYNLLNSIIVNFDVFVPSFIINYRFETLRIPSLWDLQRR